VASKPRYSISDEAVGLSIATGAIVVALGLAATGPQRIGPEASCELPGAAGDYRRADAVPLFTLPDSGGFLINGAPIARDRLALTLREIFAARDAGNRVAFVWPVSATRCGDLQYLERVTNAAGGPLFDAAASGWPKVAPGSP
jgi:hypothetical protein